MSSNRASLDPEDSDSMYVGLTIVMVILSAIGLYLYLHIPKLPPVDLVSNRPSILEPSVTLVPTNVADDPSITSTVTPSVATVTPTPTINLLTSDIDGFSVNYLSSRTLYQDRESDGNRYTLYSSSGNIAIHVGSSWSWVYPNRQFTSTFLISNQPTFRYDISSQTIVDFQSKGKKYTIQCLHHGQSALKTECQQILSDFKLH